MSTRGRLVAPLIFAALVVVTLLIGVLSQGARTRLVVDEVDLTNGFNPEKGGEATIVFRLTEDEERATLAVIDLNDEVVETLLAGEPLGDFKIHRFRWDGDDAPPGVYRVRLTLDSLGREVVLPEEIDLRGGGDG